MPPTGGSNYYAEFITQSPTTGTAQNADSLPTATATHNGIDDGSFALTVTNIDTGRYKITGTIPGGYSAGDYVQVSVAATVNAISGKAIVDNFMIAVANWNAFEIDSSGRVDVGKFLGHAVILDSNNYPGVNVVDIAGSGVSTSTAQIGVNVVQINGVATTPVTTINANQGTTQPVNFTGTAGSSLVKSDMQDIAGVAVNTSTAQIGVNIVNIAGHAVAADASGHLNVILADAVAHGGTPGSSTATLALASWQVNTATGKAVIFQSGNDTAFECVPGGGQPAIVPGSLGLGL